MHVDIWIVAIGRCWLPNRDEDALRIAAIDQDMAIAVPFRKRCNIAWAHHRFPAIIDQHRLARDHHDHFVLALMPVPLR